MTFVELGCPICHNSFKKYIGHVRRADKDGLTVYCGRTCAGIGRRTGKTPEQRKAEKAEYDRMYREREADKLKQRKKEYHERTYNPEKQKAINKERYTAHLEYLRRPEYKEYKKGYDEEYRAKQKFGDFYESAILVNKIFGLIPHKEIKLQQGLLSKNQKRKRQWKILMQNH